MAVEGSSREEILSRIRRANGAGADAGGAASARAALPPTYAAAAELDLEGRLELLVDRLLDYDAQTFRSTRSQLPELIRKRLLERGRPRMIVPPGIPGGMLPEMDGFTVDRDFSARELDGFEGVLTTATLAIAETGTLVLQNVPGQGRRAATLVPDYHLCVVHVDDVVQSVPEGLERIAATAALSTTFISGPSATADIEMTRIKGVHGPRFLDVILYGEDVDTARTKDSL